MIHSYNMICSYVANSTLSHKPPLFAQLLVQAQIKETIKDLRHRPLWGEMTGDRWFPTQRASDVQKIYLMTASCLHKTVDIDITLAYNIVFERKSPTSTRLFEIVHSRKPILIQHRVDDEKWKCTCVQRSWSFISCGRKCPIRYVDWGSYVVWLKGTPTKQVVLELCD